MPVNVICSAADVSISESWSFEMSQLWPRLTTRWRICSGTFMTLSSQACPLGRRLTALGSRADVPYPAKAVRRPQENVTGG